MSRGRDRYKMQPEIQIQEPFKKSWNEPQIIITREDIIDYENSQKQYCARQREAINTRESEVTSKSIIEHTGDCRSSTEMLQNRLMDLRNLLFQSQIGNQKLQTPKKHCNIPHGSNLVVRSDVSTTNSQVCDRIIPHYSMPRSLPSSPLTGEISNMTSSPTIPTTPERHFNFVPERSQFLEETRRLLESDEVDNGFRLSREFHNSPRGTTYHHGIHMSPPSPGRTLDSLYYKSEIQVTDTPPLRAKRKLDMDDPYSTPVKRAKSDGSQDAGLRYVNQLEMDLMALKQRVQSARSDEVNRQTHCACTKMEKHFMEMTSSAYKSIRRYDGTINSFEQFKEELTQTNKVIKDSMELLQNVRRLCVH